MKNLSLIHIYRKRHVGLEGEQLAFQVVEGDDRLALQKILVFYVERVFFKLCLLYTSLRVSSKALIVPASELLEFLWWPQAAFPSALGFLLLF